MKLKLRFPVNQIANWADKYDYPMDEDVNALIPKVRNNGFLTLENLLTVARWKSPRAAGHVRSNDDEYVKAVTRFCFQTSSERARIEALTILDGVSWPTASVVLHFFHREKYPILDFRALWSVGATQPTQYHFKFWWDYVEFCRTLAHKTGHEMRCLDQALWAYSKQNQRKGKTKPCPSA